MKPIEPDPNNPSDAVPVGGQSVARVKGTSRGERWFRSMVQNSSDVVMILETDGTVRYVSPAVERVLGYRTEDFVGTLALDYVHPEDIEYMSKSFAETLEKPGVQPPIRYRVRTADGSWRHMEAIRSNWLDDPYIAGVVANVRDVTERKEAEEALKESERYFRSLVQNASDIILVMEADRTVRYVSPAVERVLGYEPERVVGNDNLSPVHPDDMPRMEKLIGDVMRNPGITTAPVELRLGHADGSWRYVETTCTNLLGDPAVGGIVFNTWDVTERKRTEQALRESEERFKSSFRDAAIGMALVGTDGRWLQVNRSLCEMVGYTEEELLEKTFQDITHPDDLAADLALVRQMLDGEIRTYQLEKRYLHKEGRVLWVLLGVSMVRDEDGKPLYFISQVQDITRRKLTEEALGRSESSLATAQRIAHLGNWDYDPTEDEAQWSDEMYRIFGFSPRQFVPRYRTFLGLVHPDDRNLIRRSGREALYGESRGSVEYRVVRPDGDVRVVQSHYEVVRDASGRALKLIGTVHDITERKRTEERLREAEERYRTMVEVQTELVCRFLPDLTVTFANEAYCRYFGVEAGEVLGKSFIERVAVEDRVYYGQRLARLNRENPRRTVEHRVLTPGGGVRWQQWTDTALFDGEGRIVEYQSVGRDVTERREAEERLEHQALHDSLIGLPNRRLFVDRLGQALRRNRRRQGREAAVLFTDLDGFKTVNDSLGHEVGDQLLVAVAERLGGCLRPEDTLARFGGDEFVVLLEDVRGPDDAVRVAERMVGTLREPFRLHGRELFVAASIGIALGGARWKRPEELLREADTAMYRAKEEGASGYRVFDPAMHERILDRLDLENDLRRAVEREEFRLFYQPKVRLGEVDTVAEVEALLRWEHPQRGLLMPGDFIPLAEQTGLIVPIGRWVLNEACRQVKRWQQRYPRTPPLVGCVNVSAGQLRYPDLLHDVGTALRESGIEARSFALEITESALVKDMHTSLALLTELREQGIRFALDDFGSEYSSLSYLMRLPVDFVKIDKSFVRGLGEDPRAAIIVEAIVSLAHSLGLEAVGEGVESAEQLKHLRGMGCDLAQGYHLARPLPGEEVDGLLVHRNISS